MKIMKLLSVLPIGLLCMVPNVIADDIIITHRSGKVQTIRIEQNGDPVEQVSFRRGKEDVPQAQTKPQPPSAPAGIIAAPAPVTSAPPAPVTPKTAETAKEPDKSGVKIKWATPVDAGY